MYHDVEIHSILFPDEPAPQQFFQLCREQGCYHLIPFIGGMKAIVGKISRFLRIGIFIFPESDRYLRILRIGQLPIAVLCFHPFETNHIFRSNAR